MLFWLTGNYFAFFIYIVDFILFHIIFLSNMYCDVLCSHAYFLEELIYYSLVHCWCSHICMFNFFIIDSPKICNNIVSALQNAFLSTFIPFSMIFSMLTTLMLFIVFFVDLTVMRGSD